MVPHQLGDILIIFYYEDGLLHKLYCIFRGGIHNIGRRIADLWTWQGLDLPSFSKVSQVRLTVAYIDTAHPVKNVFCDIRAVVRNALKVARCQEQLEVGLHL